MLHWVNDALMAVFFLLVGLEIKRELLDGQLPNWSDRILPGIAAFGGMVAPGIVYWRDQCRLSENLRGWAIPAATDIASRSAVLALLASRVPVSLKIFLTALAILDDFGAVVIIACVLYRGHLSLIMLGLSAACFCILLCPELFRRVAAAALSRGRGRAVVLHAEIRGFTPR